MEEQKQQFRLLKPEIQREIINNLKLSRKNKLDLTKAVVYYIAPHDQPDINETESKRLERIEYLVERFNMDMNEQLPEFFTSYLCFAIYFRQEKILNFLIKKGADINFIDYIGLSPINYLCAKVIIGEKKEITNQLNQLRDKINDKVMFSTLNHMMYHKSQKLEYFHKNQSTSYCLYDAYTTSEIKDITNGNDYYELYKILCNKFQEIITDEELSKYYAVEIEEYRQQYSADLNHPQYFNKYKKMSNKNNLIEYILAEDEKGAIEYLQKNPKSIYDSDIDLQTPLHWSIYMSQYDKPVKFFKLIQELILAGSDPEHKNITGYNSIELAAYYDYCADQLNHEEKYTLLNCIYYALEEKDKNKFKKCTDEIDKYKKIMKYNNSIEEKNNLNLINSNFKNSPIFHLKINNKDEKRNIINEQKLMALEDTRQFELSNKIVEELLLEDSLKENKKISNKTPKSKKDKLKAKNHKLLLKQNAIQAQLEAEKEKLLKEKKEKLLEAEKQAQLKAEKQAQLDAELEEQLEIEKQAELEH